MLHEVTVKVADILPIIKDNREAHREIFEKAVEGYKKEWIELLELHLERVKAGKKVKTAVSLVEPQDHTADYDQAIGMLELCTNEEITLTGGEYACLIDDEWGWKNQFVATATSYGAM